MAIPIHRKQSERIKRNEDLSLGRILTWESKGTTGESVGTLEIVTDVIWDTDTGELKKETVVLTISGGRITNITSPTESVIDTTEDCA